MYNSFTCKSLIETRHFNQRLHKTKTKDSINDPFDIPLPRIYVEIWKLLLLFLQLFLSGIILGQTSLLP